MKQRVLVCGAMAMVFAAVCSVGQMVAPKGEGETVDLSGKTVVKSGGATLERSRISYATHLDFMPVVDAPPPVTVVYPSGYSKNLELASAAARKCNSVTNMSKLTHAERNTLVVYWVEVYRTNGIPEMYRGRF